MPPNWVALSVISAAVVQTGADFDLHGGITVTAERQRYDLVEQSSVYEGNVRAVTSDWVISADRMSVSRKPGRTQAVAQGDVRVEDPDGMVTADLMTWDWVNRTGKAENVKVTVGHAYLTAQRANLKPSEWLLEGVAISTCGAPNPLYEIKAPRVRITPGKRGVASSVSLWLFGRKLGTLPSYRVSFDKRASEWKLPRVGLSEGGSVSVNWSQSAFIGPNLLLGFGGEWEENYRPSYQAELRWSPIDPNNVVGNPKPYGDLSNRFQTGFMDNVQVVSPDDERRVMESQRRTVSLGTYWSVRPSGRRENPDLDKPLDLAVEQGGRVGPLAGYVQTRFQRVSRPGVKDVDRVAARASVLAPEWKLAEGTSLFVRLDAGAYTGGQTMAWGQIQSGVIFRPTRGLDLGAAWVEGSQRGEEDFAFDRLFSNRALHLRVDWHGGPTQIGLLGKYDFDRQSWYDYEFRIRQVAGCVEPFVSWRKFPNDFSFGVNLRLDELTDLLARRGRGETPARQR